MDFNAFKCYTKDAEAYTLPLDKFFISKDGINISLSADEIEQIVRFYNKQFHDTIIESDTKIIIPMILPDR